MLDLDFDLATKARNSPNTHSSTRMSRSSLSGPLKQHKWASRVSRVIVDRDGIADRKNALVAIDSSNVP